MTKSNRRMARPAKFGSAGNVPDNAKIEPQARQAAATSEIAAAPRNTKILMVANMLSRSSGASIEEIISATGWLPHTTRAALTGLKKKGHTITKCKADDGTRYAITPAA